MANSITKLLSGVQENIVLAPYTTYKIGGPARYFIVAENEEDIVKAALAAKETGTPFFILGGGSNLLISDKGFDGLVVKIHNSKFMIHDSALEADAGVDMPVLVCETTRRGLKGLEWAGGLPGTLGGAIRGNAGAFGGEIKDNILEVKALDAEGNIKSFAKGKCGFSYRSSIFKEQGMIVLSAKIQLMYSDPSKIGEEAEDHIRYRKERHPLEYPNAGSVFKNCDCNIFSENERGRFEHVIKIDPFPVVPTAYLLSEAKLKGVSFGGAMISEKHPNFIVNCGSATSNDIIRLMEIAKECIREKFGIDLEAEIQLVGFE